MANAYPQAGSSMLPQYGTASQPNTNAFSNQVGYANLFQNVINDYKRQQGQVLGAATDTGAVQGPQPNPNAGRAVAPVNTPPNPYDSVQAPSGPSQGEIDSQFNPILDVYNQAEGNLRGQLPGLISEAEAQAKASQGLLENQRTGANQLLGNQQQQTYQTQQAQTGQQRQTLQELQMANQQRFGGASSAGQAAGELQGREFQKNTFQIGQQAQQALQQIGQQRQTVEREYQQGLQQLEVNKQKAVNDIQRSFQDKLLEINARRGETESAKASARMEALQNLRNQAYQIDVSKAQFQAQLQSQAQQNTSYLDSAAQQYLSATNQGQAGVDQFSSTQQSAIPGVSDSRQIASSTMFGQIEPGREDELRGQWTNQNMYDQSVVNRKRGSDTYGNPIFNSNYNLA